MITSIIPVRKGSQRVKNKNKNAFAGSSLLEIKISQMLKLQKWNKINEIIVTSDDDDMLEIASNMGVSTSFSKIYQSWIQSITILCIHQ